MPLSSIFEILMMPSSFLKCPCHFLKFCHVPFHVIKFSSSPLSFLSSPACCLSMVVSVRRLSVPISPWAVSVTVRRMSALSDGRMCLSGYLSDFDRLLTGSIVSRWLVWLFDPPTLGSVVVTMGFSSTPLNSARSFSMNQALSTPPPSPTPPMRP